MKKTLILDLGTKSIGWAIFENDSITKSGVKILPLAQNTSQEITTSKPPINKQTLSKIEKATLGILAITTGLAAIDFLNWQFWLGLGISALLTFLSMQKK